MGKTSKYIYVLLSVVTAVLAFPAESMSQHYVGVRAGYGGGSTRIFQPEETGTLWGLYHGGVSWKYFSPEKYVGGVQADILFMQQGYRNFSSPYLSGRLDGTAPFIPPDQQNGLDSLVENRYVNSIMVPLFWQPHIYMFRRNMRIYLNLGLTFSYNISQQQSVKDIETGEYRKEKEEYKMMRTRDNRFGYGLCGGGGVGWSFGRVEVLAEMRYYIGYSDLMKNRNKYQTNPLRSPLDGLQGSVGVYYRLGKKGILSPPSKKMEKKFRELEEKRAMKAMEADGAPEIRNGGTGAAPESVPGEVVLPETVPDTAPEDIETFSPLSPEDAVLAALQAGHPAN